MIMAVFIHCNKASMVLYCDMKGVILIHNFFHASVGICAVILDTYLILRNHNIFEGDY